MDSPATRVPAAPCVAAGHALAAVLTPDGELLTVPALEAAGLIAGSLPLLIHRPATFARLGLKRDTEALDLLELFAFVCPARSAAPTARGMCSALGLEPPPVGLEHEAAALPELAEALLGRLAAGADLPANRDAAGLAAQMGAAGWPWAGAVLTALRATGTRPSGEAFRVWRRLPTWDAVPPRPPAGSHGVEPAEARQRLASLLGSDAEQRPSQADYASAATAAFAPRDVPGSPHVVLAEAGTGTGKTLGYVAPASLWAERNNGAVWISTYTKHLQRQVEAELARLEPDAARRRQRFVVRKGRENYLCLLRLEEAVSARSRAAAVPLGLISRWALATEDGDIQGGDLPGWFGELFGSRFVTGLADRRGECLHGGCPHWRRCYVEHTIRRARQAELVIANHALVLTQAALGGLDEAGVPTRYVFDEGHHLFDAADSAFSAALSGQETALLRHWLLGPENNRPGPRGLRARLLDVTADQGDLSAPLDAALTAAGALAARDWPARLSDATPELGGLEPGRSNPTEDFLRLLRRHVLARLEDDAPGPGQHECDVFPLSEGLAEAAERLERALGRIAEPLTTLRARLLARLEDEAEELTEEARGTIEGVARAILRRALNPLGAWRAMLETLARAGPAPDERPENVTLVRLDRRATGDHDVALCRHWLDPTIPFALTLGASAHGMLVTSATLRDSGGADAEAAWEAAEARIGTPHLAAPAIRAAVASPFDYAAQTRVFVVTDVVPQAGAVAGAYRALFQAASGGGLGLFTAISRLRAVHQRIVRPLEEAGIPLLAQHVDAMDNATLVDIFRSEEASCLLGTDAMRDGVDVPGRALRLVVFERVPWPRPDILHRERRIHLSGGDPGSYDCRIARLRLRQAFGRLIRRAADRGVFVLLDRQTPSRLLPAFPAPVRRVGLAEAVAQTEAFLKP